MAHVCYKANSDVCYTAAILDAAHGNVQQPAHNLLAVYVTSSELAHDVTAICNYAHLGTRSIPGRGRRIPAVWWPRSALRRRVRSGTAHVPHCVRNISAASPQCYRIVPAVFPHCFCSLSASFPQHLRSFSALFPRYLRTVAAVFPLVRNLSIATGTAERSFCLGRFI